VVTHLPPAHHNPLERQRVYGCNDYTANTHQRKQFFSFRWWVLFTLQHFTHPMEGKMVGKAARRTRKKNPDLRTLANAANVDTASVATALAVLYETEREVVIDADTRALIVSGIRSKCLTACASLQHIEQLLGGSA
jgi:hypothetical protein